MQIDWTRTIPRLIRHIAHDLLSGPIDHPLGASFSLCKETEQ